jgi:hypothetical protein
MNAIKNNRPMSPSPTNNIGLKYKNDQGTLSTLTNGTPRRTE